MRTTKFIEFPAHRGGRRKNLPNSIHTLHPASARLAAPVLLVLGAWLLAGCQELTYVGQNGEHFSRRSLGATTALAVLTVETSTNGLRRVELRGYHNDSTQALGAVTEAAVRAAIGAAK